MTKTTLKFFSLFCLPNLRRLIPLINCYCKFTANFVSQKYHPNPLYAVSLASHGTQTKCILFILNSHTDYVVIIHKMKF